MAASEPTPIPDPDAHDPEGLHQAGVAPTLSMRSRFVVAGCIVLFFAIPAYMVFAHPLSGVLHASAEGAPNAMSSQTSTPSIATLEEQVRRNPSVDARITLSLAYINGGAVSRSIPLLQSVVADDRKNIVAWNNLCVANILQKSYDLATQACQTAISIDPNFQLARNNLKWAQDEQARAPITLKTEESTPPTSDANAYINQGMGQLNLGHYDHAIGLWRHALQVDPKNAIAANNIGTAYMMKNQADEALVWFNKALALDPNLQLASNNLAWARSKQAHPSTR